MGDMLDQWACYISFRPFLIHLPSNIIGDLTCILPVYTSCVPLRFLIKSIYLFVIHLPSNIVGHSFGVCGGMS